MMTWQEKNCWWFLPISMKRNRTRKGMRIQWRVGESSILKGNLRCIHRNQLPSPFKGFFLPPLHYYKWDSLNSQRRKVRNEWNWLRLLYFDGWDWRCDYFDCEETKGKELREEGGTERTSEEREMLGDAYKWWKINSRTAPQAILQKNDCFAHCVSEKIYP